MKGKYGMPVGTVLEREEFADMLGNDTEGKLVGRMAYCHVCGKVEWSSVKLPHFEYTGEGSRSSRKECKCGLHEEDHKPCAWHVDERSMVERVTGKLHEFRAKGAQPMDMFYCGCRKDHVEYGKGNWKKWLDPVIPEGPIEEIDPIDWSWCKGQKWFTGKQ